jgi:hypothetical protein
MCTITLWHVHGTGQTFSSKQNMNIIKHVTMEMQKCVLFVLLSYMLLST